MAENITPGLIDERINKAPLLSDVKTDNSNYKVAALQMIR